MNGFTWWVLLAATGQVADVPQRDYGWQISKKDGLLEYIVQISPEKANYMIAEGKEFESTIPPEVAARVSRIIVSIGDQPIVSTPMEKVLNVPPVTKAVLANIESEAGRGRFSELESAPRGDVMNVAGGNASPPLTSGGAASGNSPNNGPSSLGAMPSGFGSSLSDSSSPPDNHLAQNTNSGFFNDTRGLSTTGASGPSKFSSTGQASPALPSSGQMPAAAPLSGAPLAGAPPQTTFPSSATNPFPTNTAPPASQSGHTTAGSSPLNNGSLNNGSLNNGSLNNGSLSGTQYGTNPIGNTASAPLTNSGGYSAGPGSNLPGYNGTATYPSNNQSYNSLPTANGNFGSPPRAVSTTSQPYPYGVGSNNPANNLGTQGNYPYPQAPIAQSPNYGGVSPYASDPLSLPYNSQPLRTADSRNSGLPTTSAGSGLNTTAPGPGNNGFGSNGLGSNGLGNNGLANNGLGSNGVRGNDHLQDANYATQYANSRSGVENIVPVMFVLSLVVNFYLGMLIRKLLTRYRSLLSSVRSQAI